MKALITLAIIVGIYLLGKSVMDEYKAKQQKEKEPVTVEVLEGLPSNFEESLQAAQAQGAPALKEWLQKYGHYARDPRLAEIQLNYVVLVSRTDPTEARQLFQAVKRRTPKTSPVYERIKRLESTYGK
jgi:hypothetical protein